MPGIATISIFGFLGSWNGYLLPLIVLNKQSSFTMPLLIQQLNTSLYNRDFGAMSMGVAISVIPILLMFIFFSRYLIEGISSDGVKE
jgi:ABC-type glycerol-3-phosphate transport system permease component